MVESDLMFKRQRVIDSDDEEMRTNFRDADDYNRLRGDLEYFLENYLKNSKVCGIGIPMRTRSYILGYNPKINDPLKFKYGEKKQLKSRKYSQN